MFIFSLHMAYLWVVEARLENQREERQWAAFLKILKMLKQIEEAS